MKPADTVRVNVVLPADLVEDLRQHVPPRQRSSFVAQAVAREIRRRRLQEALSASVGAWQDADHVDLADGQAIDRWIAERRSELDWARPPES